MKHVQDHGIASMPRKRHVKPQDQVLQEQRRVDPEGLGFKGLGFRA